MSRINPELLKKPGLSRRVLELLSRMQPLPSKGIVAGQAVASAIDVILGTGLPVFNDVDVFVDPPEWSELDPLITGTPVTRGKRSPQAQNPWFTLPVNYSGTLSSMPSALYDAEMRDYLPANVQQNFYKVLKSRRHGLLNVIMVDYASVLSTRGPSPAKLRERRTLGLLQGFDINSTQVAINLESGKLYYTKAFAHYFSTRQLRIIAVFTPVHTFLRYFKKRAELQCFGNDEAAVRLFALRLAQVQPFAMLNQSRVKAFYSDQAALEASQIAAIQGAGAAIPARDLHSPVGSGRSNSPFILGTKYKDMLDRYGGPLRELIFPVPHPSKQLWLMSSPAAAKPVTSAKPLPLCATAMPLRYEEQGLQPSKQALRREALFELYLTQFSVDLKTWYQQQFTEYGGAYLEGIDSPLRSMVARLLIEHQELQRPLYGLPFNEQISFLQLARNALEDANMPLAWGVFGSRSSWWAKQSLLRPNLMQEAMDAIRPTLLPVAEPLNVPQVSPQISVVELLSGHELALEGTLMNHCVGGYTPNVAEGQCRILSFRKGPLRNERATVEWGFSEARDQPPFATKGKRKIYPLQAVLRQARTFSNQVPTQDFLEVEAQTRKEFNIWALLHPAEMHALVRPQHTETKIELFDY